MAGGGERSVNNDNNQPKIEVTPSMQNQFRLRKTCAPCLHLLLPDEAGMRPAGISLTDISFLFANKLGSGWGEWTKKKKQLLRALVATGWLGLLCIDLIWISATNSARRAADVCGLGIANWVFDTVESGWAVSGRTLCFPLRFRWAFGMIWKMWESQLKYSFPL